MTRAAAWLVICAIAGTVAGCISAFAPAVRSGSHHSGIDEHTADGTCLQCHEPEQAAMRRLMEIPPSARQAEMDQMMGEWGASLVAKWMIEDPRGCVGCHGLARNL